MPRLSAMEKPAKSAPWRNAIKERHRGAPSRSAIEERHGGTPSRRAIEERHGETLEKPAWRISCTPVSPDGQSGRPSKGGPPKALSAPAAVGFRVRRCRFPLRGQPQPTAWAVCTCRRRGDEADIQRPSHAGQSVQARRARPGRADSIRSQWVIGPVGEKWASGPGATAVPGRL